MPDEDIIAIVADFSFIAEEKNSKLMSSEGMEATEQELESFADEDLVMDPVNP